MAGEQVEVMLAINDRNGRPSGRCVQLEVHEPYVFLEPLIKIEWDPMDEDEQPECTMGVAGLRFEGRERPFECSDWKRFVGNLFWDRCTMTLADARELVRLAVETHHGSVTEWSDGPFQDVADAARALECGTFGGVSITPEIRARMDADRAAAEAEFDGPARKE